MNLYTTFFMLINILFFLKSKQEKIIVIMSLQPLDYLNGILSIITVLTGILVGLVIALKYFELRRRVFLYVGIAVMGTYQPWWPTAVSFFTILIFERPLTSAEYFLITITCIPFFIVLWMLAINDLLVIKNRIILPLIFLIVSSVAEVYIWYYCFTEPSKIGTLSGYFDAEYALLTMLYLLFILMSIVITGIVFSIQSFKSDKPEIRLKGKLLILGFLCYLIGGFIDAGTIHLNVITIIIARTILILSAIFFYFGFLLPDFVRKLFIKSK